MAQISPCSHVSSNDTHHLHMIILIRNLTWNTCWYAELYYKTFSFFRINANSLKIESITRENSLSRWWPPKLKKSKAENTLNSNKKLGFRYPDFVEKSASWFHSLGICGNSTLSNFLTYFTIGSSLHGDWDLLCANLSIKRICFHPQKIFTNRNIFLLLNLTKTYYCIASTCHIYHNDGI